MFVQEIEAAQPGRERADGGATESSFIAGEFAKVGNPGEPNPRHKGGRLRGWVSHSTSGMAIVVYRDSLSNFARDSRLQV